MPTSHHSMRLLAPLAAIATLLGLSHLARAQSGSSFSVGTGYTFVRTNVLPGCNCVGLEGGSAEVQYRFVPHLAALADVTVAHRSGITPDGYSLTQTAYTLGFRYWPAQPGVRLRPFADVRLGEAHASGNLSPHNVFAGSSNAFAMQTGGGLQIGIGSRWTLQPIQAEYLLTTFANGAANRQNDLRVSSGLLFRLGR
jgi:outer membrane immunogenic protein